MNIGRRIRCGQARYNSANDLCDRDGVLVSDRRHSRGVHDPGSEMVHCIGSIGCVCAHGMACRAPRVALMH